MVTLKLLKRPTEGIIVVRDAGVPHPPNDIDADRTFSVGEQIGVRLDEPGPLRQESLHADVIGVDERGVIARARHSVYRATERGNPDNPVVKSGTEFTVPRECVFTVWKASTPSQVVQVPVTIPAGTKAPEETFRALIEASLKVVDCAVPHNETRDLVPASFVRVLKEVAEDIEHRLRRGSL